MKFKKLTLKLTSSFFGIGIAGYVLNKYKSIILHSYSDEVNENLLIYSEQIKECKKLVKRYQIEHGIPGVIVAVSKNNQLIYSKGFGYSDVENNVKASPNTVMRIASISKPLTCLLAAKLIETNQLDLDLPIDNYLNDIPQFKLLNDKMNRTFKINARQLMSHTSGIRHYEKKLDTEEEKDNEKVKINNNNNSNNKVESDTNYDEFYISKNYKTTKESLDIFINDYLLYEPGTKFLYTTHGYTLLSYLIEKIATKKDVLDSKIKDQPFSGLMSDLFKLLDLNNTFLDQNDPIIPNRSKYYMRNKKKRLINVPYVDLSYKWAGGGVMSNVNDLIKFGNLMLDWYQTDDSNSNKFLKSTTIKNLLWSPQVFDEKKTQQNNLLFGSLEKKEKIYYGLGWFLCMSEDLNNKKLKYAYHTGGAVGASSCLLVAPNDNKKENLVVAVLCNSQDLSDIRKFTNEILEIFTC